MARPRAHEPGPGVTPGPVRTGCRAPAAAGGSGPGDRSTQATGLAELISDGGGQAVLQNTFGDNVVAMEVKR